MWPVLIIVHPPDFGNIPGMFQADKPILVQTIVSQSADKALGESILKGIFAITMHEYPSGWK
jgi:hypothetical protein